MNNHIFNLAKEYIDTVIVPKYASFDKGHNQDHARSVIQRSLAYANALEEEKGLNLNRAMIYVISGFHDLGLSKGRENHGVESAKMLLDDAYIKELFSFNDIIIMAIAIEDHRTVYTGRRRNLYGAVLADADKEINPIESIKRLWGYRNSNNGNHYGKPYQEMNNYEKFLDMMDYLNILYAPGGKMYQFELKLMHQNGMIDETKKVILGNVEFAKKVLLEELDVII